MSVHCSDDEHGAGSAIVKDLFTDTDKIYLKCIASSIKYKCLPCKYIFISYQSNFMKKSLGSRAH